MLEIFEAKRAEHQGLIPAFNDTRSLSSAALIERIAY